MSKFPVDKISVVKAKIWGAPGDVSLEIYLSTLLIGDATETTSIRLDGIQLPSSSLQDVVDGVYIFPKNPDDGYIDGSIYIQHAHHPVDVTEISVGEISGNKLATQIKAEFLFSHESLEDYEDFSMNLKFHSINSVE